MLEELRSEKTEIEAKLEQSEQSFRNAAGSAARYKYLYELLKNYSSPDTAM